MRLTLAISVQLADHDIGRVTDHGTEDTGNITTKETNSCLGQLAITFLGLSHGLIDHLHRLLKSSKFSHGVRNLASPQWVQALVEATKPFLCNNPAPALAQIAGIWWQSSLHAYFDCFHGAQSHISKELSRSAGAQEDEGAVRVGKHAIAIEILEVLIQPVLASALERVAQESGRPAKKHTAQAFLGEDRAPCGDVGGVNFWVDLSPALDQIKRCYSSVGWS